MKNTRWIKTTLIVLNLSISPIFAFCQGKVNIDSLSNEICNTLRSEVKSSDSLTFQNAFRKHLLPLSNNPEIDIDSTFAKCFFRMQRFCNELTKLLDRVNTNKGDWQPVEITIETKASKKECEEFFKIGNFKYKEINGDSTQVIITEDSWTDYFKNGTISKLSLVKKNISTFEITFIESSNESRQNLSKKGDKYIYRILEKRENYYLMLTTIPDSNVAYQFKMYF